MENNQIAKLRRMRDHGPQNYEVNRRIADGIFSVLNDHSFLPLDTPLLEQTDLFVRKSGGEIAESLYTFSDPGGIAVSLRPEFTPSVIRWFVENIGHEPGNHKFQYVGPVFRYGGARGGRNRQFTQCGAELIGTPAHVGDSEILESAAQCLHESGISNYSVRLGHIGLVRELVRSQGLAEPLQMFILANLDAIEDGEAGIERLTDQAAAAGLVFRSDSEHLDLPARDDAIPALEALGRSLPGPTGRRSREQIMVRLANRMRKAVPESDFRSALTNVSALLNSPTTVSDPLESIAAVMESSGASLSAVDELSSAFGSVSRIGDDVTVELDLSFVRGRAYYTGIVFEYTSKVDGVEASLGGGGRYDDLVRAFGGPNTPACGFALNLDELVLVAQAGSVGASA
ncbi:MAG: ATP phosphoribosyltransferase regulatory subunit [Dehalococcoidia bacterium]|nr:ATP phosphoribosyltransferase regulatory subunit [Dehalococcoidia bacterium]